MEQRKVTAENPEKVKKYIPLARKYAIVQILAPGCIEQTESGFWRENIIGKKLVEVYVLAGVYFHDIDTSGLEQPTPKFEMTLHQYDTWAGLEDFIAANGDKDSLELLADFRSFKDILDREIAARLAEKNDPFNRFQEALRLGLTPDVVQELQKAVEAAKDTGEAK